jgi:hypothetical protein
VHLAPGSLGWSAELEPELARFDAALVGKGPRSLTFDVPASRTRPFIQRLFDLLQVHDLSIERQPLEHLIKTIFRSGELAPARASEDALPRVEGPSA